LRDPTNQEISLDLFLCAYYTNTPPPGDTNKWLQIPDTSQNGLDVLDTGPNPLADDFRCTATGPITQVRIWGSWLFDQIPPTAAAPCFDVNDLD